MKTLKTLKDKVTVLYSFETYRQRLDDILSSDRAIIFDIYEKLKEQHCETIKK